MGLYLIKALRVRSARGRCCGSQAAGGDDVSITIIIILREVIVVSMAVREEFRANYLGSGALPNCEACRGPFLIADGVAATTVGIDNGCPNPRRSSKWQFACRAPRHWFGRCLNNRRRHCHVGREAPSPSDALRDFMGVCVGALSANVL